MKKANPESKNENSVFNENIKSDNFEEAKPINHLQEKQS